jgi:cytochrome c553
MKLFVLVAVLLTAPVVSAQESAAGKADPFTGGSAEAGAAKAAVCGACHGPGGNSSNPEWPKLAGQHAAYTYAQLKVLKSGERKMPVMNAQAANLSDQDMRDLSAYFAAQKPSPGVASPDSVKTAQKLYRAGDTARGLPACAACHGPQGHGNAAAAYPRIGGQQSKYAAKVLRDYQAMAGMNIPFPNALTMAAVAAKLTDAEVEALASYVNGLQ